MSEPDPAVEPTAEPDAEPTAEPDAEPTAEPDAEPTAEPAAAPAGRLRRLLRRIPHPAWRSRRGLLLLFLLFAGFGSAMALGLVSGVRFTETTRFCGRCHTMDPELRAHELSPHRRVECAECHVEPGVGGFVKAKVRGSKQLVQVLTGTYPKPIPPPSHSQLPSVADTCLRCHSIEQITRNDGPVKLILRPTYQMDEPNSRHLIAMIVRPNGLVGGADLPGVHWHVQQQVTYYSTDPSAATMDLIEIDRPDGSVDRYVRGTAVTLSADAQADLARLRRTDRRRVMDCLDCHNRTGHAVPSVGQAVDDAIASGRISASLPYVKRDSVGVLTADYPTHAAADQAIDRLFATYLGRYPLNTPDRRAQVAASADAVKSIYRLVATPEMKVQAQTYADNLGHQQSPGCFRCHDGAHYQVVGGQVTDRTIPSTCSTCHTFPQVGQDVTGVLLGGAPASHSDRLYVFQHRNLATSADPAGTSCGACHNRTYCVNCHSTGAIGVRHDEMLYNHAVTIKKVGGQSCAYCHQGAYCARCHSGDVLRTRASGSGHPRHDPSLGVRPTRGTVSPGGQRRRPARRRSAKWSSTAGGRRRA